MPHASQRRYAYATTPIGIDLNATVRRDLYGPLMLQSRGPTRSQLNAMTVGLLSGYGGEGAIQRLTMPFTTEHPVGDPWFGQSTGYDGAHMSRHQASWVAAYARPYTGPVLFVPRSGQPLLKFDDGVGHS